VAEFSNSFNMLLDAFQKGMVVETILVSLRTQKDVEQLRISTSLTNLAVVKMDASQHDPCLPGTRSDIIKFVTDWVLNSSDDQKNVLWVWGVAGAGKSTLSTTLVASLIGLHRLGASIFFSRNNAEQPKPATVIQTIVHQLAQFDARIGSAIARAIESKPQAVGADLETQLEVLLIKPLHTVEELAIEGPIVIILDALDECGKEGDQDR